MVVKIRVSGYTCVSRLWDGIGMRLFYVERRNGVGEIELLVWIGCFSVGWAFRVRFCVSFLRWFRSRGVIFRRLGFVNGA